MGDTLTTCVYCGCGCGLYLKTVDDRVVGATASRNHPVSRNNLCAKGWNVHEFIHHPERLTEPLIRKNGRLSPSTWDEALDLAAREFSRIRDRTDADAIGVLSSAKCTNEENYLLQKLTRAVFKTNNIDHCARL